MPNTVAPKVIKYLGINLPKNVQDITNTKKCKALLRKISKIFSTFRDRLFSQIRRLSIVRVLILPN